MPRLLRLFVLLLAFFVSGAPAWAGELCKDDCAEECEGDESSCPEQGCTDCSIACSSCPRTVGLASLFAVRTAPACTHVTWVTSNTVERTHDDPVPEGVFHPPRTAG